MPKLLNQIGGILYSLGRLIAAATKLELARWPQYWEEYCTSTFETGIVAIHVFAK